jgi:hypothetical protein
MTVLVSGKVNDGIVMAAGSTSLFASGMIYYHSHKIMNIHARLPVG